MISVVTKDAESKLLEKVGRLRSEPIAWRGLHLRFSGLLDLYRSEYQRNIIVNVMMDHLRDSEGGIYICTDFDIFVICSGINRQQLEKLVFQLRYLFSDDPLAYTIEGEENTEFCAIYDLSVSWLQFHDACRRKVQTNTRREMTGMGEASLSDHVSRAPIAPPKRATKIMTPAKLSEIERDLAGVDLSRVLRRQPICAMPAGQEPRKVFDEYYINIAHLQRLMMAEVNFYSNPWLFKYLTQLLDHKMIAMLSRRAAYYFENPVSINMNIDTLTSEKFLEFDEQIKPSLKVSIVLELHVGDVFSAMETFINARKSIQKLGYRICLDGLTLNSFTQVDREKLGFDLAKLQWHMDMEAPENAEATRRLASVVQSYGPNRVILCRCDTKNAIQFGQKVGISLFQGRYVDYILNPNAKLVN